MNKSRLFATRNNLDAESCENIVLLFKRSVCCRLNKNQSNLGVDR